MTDDLHQDRDELAAALRSSVDAELGLTSPHLGDALARGRVLRQRRTMAFAGAALALALCAAVAGPRVAEAFRTGDSNIAASMNAEELGAGAATIGIRSIAQAGLMNAFEDFYSYRGTEKIRGAWRVSFLSEDAPEDAPADTHLEVRLDDDDWVVAAVEGPMDDDARAKVLSYRTPAEAIAPHPEFAPVLLRESTDPAAEGGGLDVRASTYWAGPIPERRITFACHLEAFDESGRLVHDTQAQAYTPPSSESERSGGTLGTALPPGVDAARAEMRCERFTGPGWELVDQPSIEPRAGGKVARVRGEVVWSARAVVGVDMDCELRLLDADGNVLGERAFPMSGPWAPNDEPPITQPLDQLIDIAPPGTEIDSASFTCTLPEPPIQHKAEEPEDDAPPPTARAGPLDRPEPPLGPRHTIAEGLFEGPEWGDYEGQPWVLQVWADERYRCYSFDVGEEIGGEQGRACAYLHEEPHKDHLGSHSYHPAALYDGELSIAFGELSESVERVRIETSTGEVTEVDALIPPPELGIDARYFLAFVEQSESVDVVVLDAEGRRLN